MKKCMGIDKPLVSIVLAVYKPNESWLIEQLDSLNRQIYPQLELIVWDDCPDSPVDEGLFQRCITNIHYTLIRGETNLGSNGAFEELTKLAKGKYISYCDQDDIWNSDKIALMVEKLEQTNSVLVCSDLYIIDQEGKKLANSITAIRKRHVFREGKGLAKYLLVSNFVTGCAMLMETELAKKAVPFETFLVHDQWLAIIAALHGSIAVIYEPLIGYRQHGHNQTGILTGVTDKESYYEQRIAFFINRTVSLKSKLYTTEELKDTFDSYECWLKSREKYFRKVDFCAWKKMVKFKQYGRQTVLLETLMPLIPNFIFKRIVKLAQKGIL